MALHIETPLIESSVLGQITGKSVRLKLESLQPPGSFKIRGIGYACEIYAAKGFQRFISSSGGNAGLAVAYAGRQLNIPVTVVVPKTTTERAQELLSRENAEVIVHGASWQEANELAQTLMSETDAFIHPFDNPLLWTGHATMIDEICSGGYQPEAVILSVGGGGLLCGVVEGLHRNGLSKVPVLAVETAGAASFQAALQAGQPIELERITSIATSLGAKKVCEQAVRWSVDHPLISVVVSDQSALAAGERLLADHRLLVEPASSASLAVIYDQMPVIQAYDDLLVIVCGGATATITQIRHWQTSLAESNY